MALKKLEFTPDSGSVDTYVNVTTEQQKWIHQAMLTKCYRETLQIAGVIQHRRVLIL